MFLLLISLFIPLVASADATLCGGFNQTNNSQGCIDEAGCYFDGTNCNKCPQTSGDHGYYCPPQDAGCGSSDGKCNCPAQFNNSFLGTESIDDCYASVTCGETGAAVRYNDNNPELLTINGNTFGSAPTNYHYEGGTNYSCESNTAACSSWVTTYSGQAQWDETHRYWNVLNCYYDQTNQSMASEHCTATERYTATGPNGPTTLGGGSISFSVGSYYCTSCDNGYIPNNAPNTDCTPPAGASVVVCQCDQSPAGTYLTQQCTWNAQNLNSMPNCVPTQCPRGTTSPAGSTTAQACQYSANAQICDGDGTNCKSISSIAGGGWSPM